jgi:hypothetical protein
LENITFAEADGHVSPLYAGGIKKFNQYYAQKPGERWTPIMKAIVRYSFMAYRFGNWEKTLM